MQEALEAGTNRAHRSSRRGMQGRARGAVLGGVVLFVLIQAGLSVLIAKWRPELRDPTFEIKYRQFARLLRERQQPATTVVFLGSSMSANGMKADIVEGPLTAALGRPVVGYNLATNGAGPLVHLVYMERLLRRGVRPDLVVLELAPLFYVTGQARFDLLRFPAHVLEYRDLDTLERHASEPDRRSDWWQARLVPIYGHRSAILNQSVRVFVPFDERVELWSDTDEHGWRGRAVPSPQEHEQILRDIENQYKARYSAYQIDEAPLKALRELTDLLAKERIATVLVLMPEGPLMRSFYGPGSLAPLMREFTTLSRRHGFPLVQAREWFDEGKFRDSYHLNEEGARAFTERLLREGIAPTLASRHEMERWKHAGAR